MTDKRCEGLVSVPRPRTVGEVGSYVGDLGFVRNMLLKEYSGATECLVLRPVVQAYSALAAQHCRSNEG